MVVKLPREATGRELLEAIQEAAKELESDGFVMNFSKEERYEPGSVRRGIEWGQIDIFKPRKFVQKSGFLRRKTETVVEYGRPSFDVQKLFSDGTYDEVDIGINVDYREINSSMFDSYQVFSRKYQQSAKDKKRALEEIRPVFEKLVAAIYQRLSSKEALPSEA